MAGDNFFFHTNKNKLLKIPTLLKDVAAAIFSFDHLKSFSFGFKIRSICENISDDFSLKCISNRCSCRFWSLAVNNLPSFMAIGYIFSNLAMEAALCYNLGLLHWSTGLKTRRLPFTAVPLSVCERGVEGRIVHELIWRHLHFNDKPFTKCIPGSCQIKN